MIFYIALTLQKSCHVLHVSVTHTPWTCPRQATWRVLSSYYPTFPGTLLTLPGHFEDKSKHSMSRICLDRVEGPLLHLLNIPLVRNVIEEINLVLSILHSFI